MHVLLYGSYSRERYRAATDEEIERMLRAPRVDHRCCPPGTGTDVFIAPAKDDREFWPAWHARHRQDQAPAEDLTSTAGKLGRDAGKTAASWVFDGNTPGQACRRVLRGIDEGDPEILDAWQPPGLSAEEDYTEADLADDLGLADGDPAMADAATAYLDAASESFWHEVERLARDHLYPSGCYTCACCGFPEMDATPVCGQCRAAGCEPGRSGAYPDCQRDGGGHGDL